ncbi:MAG: hypothetical protein Ct9H90mP3_8080 [Flammeovirgaceae bacterium]|nr:MAG: hypothetical protein Ct9H90mP3_8080 [Flammeovirgaceae bacterium]
MSEETIDLGLWVENFPLNAINELVLFSKQKRNIISKMMFYKISKQ